MRPMLAAKAEIKDVRFPCLVSPKLDGIRAVVKNGVLLSRSLKPIRNKYTQALFGRPEYEGFDGELIVGPVFAKDVFRVTDSGVMTIEGTPDVTFYVFDDWANRAPYDHRLDCLRAVISNRRKSNRSLEFLDHSKIKNAEQLEEIETAFLEDGAEGVIIRDPSGWYKFGRSTLREGGMLKLKRYSDSEAQIIGFVEAMENTNEPTINDLGLQTRSKDSDGLIGKGTMGALIVREVGDTPWMGATFNVGTGFDDALRAEIWDNRGFWKGKIVKYSYFNHGIKDKPRHPSYIGLRSPEDMSK